MQSLITLFYSAAICVAIMSCKSNTMNTILEIENLADSVKQIYAPDSRVALFKPQISLEAGRLVLTGQSDQKEAVDLFIKQLKGKVLDYDGEIELLPNETVGEYAYAQVNNSVSNLRSNNKHSSELASQATLGMMLKVLKRTKEWYLVQSPDKYIAWVDHGGVVLKTEQNKIAWDSCRKVIITSNVVNAFALTDKAAVLSDLVLGDVAELISVQENDFEIKFPDGRTGFVSKEAAMIFSDWQTRLVPSGELIETYARSMMGLPYLWGGTSSKGADCSGFTKTIYFMNGMVIPRDASQQVNEGLAVDKDLKFEGLLKGDLMFFGRPATDSTNRRVTHVAIWLGNGDFIHASQKVRMSSIDPTVSYYDEYNVNRYLGSRRYLLDEEMN